MLISNSLIVAETVWATNSGYPAVITEVSSSQISGSVISPSGKVQCTWNDNGVNTVGKPDFFNLKYSPKQITHRYALIKSGALIGAVNAESAEEDGRLNNADIICQFAELFEHINKI